MVAVAFNIGDAAFLKVNVNTAATSAHITSGLTHLVGRFRRQVEGG